MDKRVEFLYLFTQEIQWPDLGKQQNFYVEVVGRDPQFYRALKNYLADQTVRGKKISITNTKEWGMRNSLISPNVLYVTESAHHLLPNIVKFFQGYPVLIVSGEPYQERGWMISMSQRRTNARNRHLPPGTIWEEWVYAVNRENIEKGAKLRVSNRLLRNSSTGRSSTPTTRRASVEPTPDERIASLETEISRFKTALSLKDSAILVQMEVIGNLKDTIGEQRAIIDSLEHLALIRFTTAYGFLHTQNRMPLSVGHANALPPKDFFGRSDITGTALYDDFSPESSEDEQVSPWVGRRFGWIISVVLGLVAIGALLFMRQGVKYQNVFDSGGETMSATMAAALADDIESDEWQKQESVQNAFLANVSHELRTPLNAIVGLSQYVASTSPENTEVSESLRIINQNAHGLLRVMDGIITMAMIDAGIMLLNEAPVELPPLLAKLDTECHELISNVGKQNEIKFINNISENLPEVAILDSDKVQTVLGVLLSNAVNFTTHGEIVFACIPQYDNEPTIHFYVEDSGPGMTPDQLKKIFTQKKGFERESKSKDGSGGMGLGLSIAQRLTTIMKSELVVESTVGVGTKASFSIPLKVPDDEASAS